jgi:hypothetical protein
LQGLDGKAALLKRGDVGLKRVAGNALFFASKVGAKNNLESALTSSRAESQRSGLLLTL